MKLKRFIISDSGTHLFSLKTKVFSCCKYASSSCLTNNMHDGNGDGDGVDDDDDDDNDDDDDEHLN
jgi:hypothetical protein